MITSKSFWQPLSPTNFPWHDACPFQPKESTNQVELITKVLLLITVSEIFQLRSALDISEWHSRFTDFPYSKYTCGALIISGHVALAPALKKWQFPLYGYYINTKNMSTLIKHATHRKKTPLTPRKSLGAGLPLHSWPEYMQCTVQPNTTMH